jgi:hypothetical protein
MQAAFAGANASYAARRAPQWYVLCVRFTRFGVCHASKWQRHASTASNTNIDPYYQLYAFALTWYAARQRSRSREAAEPALLQQCTKSLNTAAQ